MPIIEADSYVFGNKKKTQRLQIEISDVLYNLIRDYKIELCKYGPISHQLSIFLEKDNEIITKTCSTRCKNHFKNLFQDIFNILDERSKQLMLNLT